MAELRVLSIQSHVVRGYVGNKAATFPIQVNGIEVDAINSVHFSTHTFYPIWKGQIMDSAQLYEIFDALKANDLHKKYTHLLTGYCRDPQFLLMIADILRTLREVNPSFKYICDPVMGDRGHYYVPEELMPIYRDTILPLADVVVPNQFELGELTSMPVTTEEQVLAAVGALHKRNVQRVVVTSTELSANAHEMFVYSSEVSSSGTVRQHRFIIEKIDATFVGTGDLFSALLLVWLHKSDDVLDKAVTMVLRIMHHILVRTLAHAKVLAGDRAITAADCELLLVQSTDLLTNPPPYDTRTVLLKE